MTNPYYVPDNANAARPGQTVRSAQFNDNNNTIEQGFDLLPVPMDLFSNRQNFGISTADVANVYEVSIEPTVLTSYQDGMQIEVRFPTSNTGPAQLNLNSLGVKQIRTIQGEPVISGDIVANASGGLRFDLANDWWQLDTALSTTQNFANQAAASALASATSAGEAATSAGQASQSASSAAQSASDADSDADRAEEAARVAQAGSVPLLQPRQVGDGTTTTFSAPHTIAIEPQGLYLNIDGLKQRPVTDYTTPNIGQVVFDKAPPGGAEIDITWFAPLVLSDPDLLVTAEGSTTPRALSKRFADVVNVKDFGVVGDGTTDDTAAIQLLLDSVGNFKVIYFPEGTYLISGQLIVNGQGIRFQGAGRQITRLQLNYINTPSPWCIRVRHSQFNCVDLEVRGTSDVVEKGSDTPQRAFHIIADLNNNNGDAWFENVAFTFFNACIHQQARNINLENCLMSNGHFGVLIAGTVNDFRGLNISSSCRFHSMTKTGEAGACIWCPPASNFMDLTINKPYADDNYQFFFGFASNTTLSVHSARARGTLAAVTDVGHSVTLIRKNFDIHNTTHNQAFNLTEANNALEIQGAQYDFSLTSTHISGVSGHGVFITKPYAFIDGLRIDDCGLAENDTYDGLNLTSTAFGATIGDVRVTEAITGDGGSNFMRNALRLDAANCLFTSKFNVVNIQNGEPIRLPTGGRVFGETPRIFYPRIDYYNNITDFNGQTIGTGDIFYNIGSGATEEQGFVVTTPGVIGTDAVLQAFGIRFTP